MVQLTYHVHERGARTWANQETTFTNYYELYLQRLIIVTPQCDPYPKATLAYVCQKWTLYE